MGAVHEDDRAGREDGEDKFQTVVAKSVWIGIRISNGNATPPRSAVKPNCMVYKIIYEEWEDHILPSLKKAGSR